MSQPELQSLADQLADRIGRAVAIDAPDMTLLAHTAHTGVVDGQRIHTLLQLRASDEFIAHVERFGIASAHGPVKIPAAPDLDLLSRLCVPIRSADELLGYIFLIDADGTIGVREESLVIAAAVAAARVLAPPARTEGIDLEASQRLVELLLSTDRHVVERGVELLRESHPLLSSGDLVVLTGRQGHEWNARRHDTLNRLAEAHETVAACLMLGPLAGSLSTVLADGEIVVVTRAVARAGVSSLPADALALRAALDENGMPCVVGVGSVSDGPREISVSYRAARAAASVGIRLRVAHGVQLWSECGADGQLVQLIELGLLPGAVPDGLVQILQMPGGDKLMETVETYLDFGGNAQRAAQALFVHRASLYYRLNRLQDLSGLSLANGDQRLALHLGVKLARLLGLWNGPRHAGGATG